MISPQSHLLVQTFKIIKSDFSLQGSGFGKLTVWPLARAPACTPVTAHTPRPWAKRPDGFSQPELPRELLKFWPLGLSLTRSGPCGEGLADTISCGARLSSKGGLGRGPSFG